MRFLIWRIGLGYSFEFTGTISTRVFVRTIAMELNQNTNAGLTKLLSEKNVHDGELQSLKTLIKYEESC